MDWQRMKAETRCWTGPSVRPEHEGVETPAMCNPMVGNISTQELN